MAGTTCAGKTTHGRRLAETFGLRYVSSGEIARRLMDADTSRSFAQGGLSPHDTEICNEVRKAIDTELVGLVLDGFPRTKHHYGELKSWLRDRQIPPPILIYFAISEYVAIARSKNRGRDEFDKEGATAKRHLLFVEQTKPVIHDMMVLAGWPTIIMEINKDKPKEEVWQFIRETLKKPRAMRTVIHAKCD
jgi:adenylate kinase family enzyme